MWEPFHCAGRKDEARGAYKRGGNPSVAKDRSITHPLTPHGSLAKPSEPEEEEGPNLPPPSSALPREGPRQALCTTPSSEQYRQAGVAVLPHPEGREPGYGPDSISVVLFLRRLDEHRRRVGRRLLTNVFSPLHELLPREWLSLFRGNHTSTFGAPGRGLRRVFNLQPISAP